MGHLTAVAVSCSLWRTSSWPSTEHTPATPGLLCLITTTRKMYQVKNHNNNYYYYSFDIAVVPIEGTYHHGHIMYGALTS